MALTARLEHVSVGCNRTPHCVDWNGDGLLAYGADKSIALSTDSNDGRGPEKVVATLHGHRERVNCVRWISHRQTQGWNKATAQVPDQNTARVSDQATAQVSDQDTACVSDQATAQVSDQATAQVSDQATAQVSDQATAQVSDQATAQVSDQATARVTDQATAQVSDQATAWVTDQATAQVSDQATAQVSDQATAQVSDQATAQVSDQATAQVSDQATALELVSGSVDKDVIVWRERDSKFSAVQTLSAHTASVTCLAAIYLLTDTDEQPGGETPAINTLIASGSSDSSVIIWERKGYNSHFCAMQTISFGRGFALGLDFHLLPGTEEPIFACGGDDAKVNLFIRRDGKFVKEQSLAGHEDWIRDLHFTQEASTKDLLLASCSQDTYIRLWRVAAEGRSQRAGSGEEDKGELKLTGNLFSVLIGQREHRFAVTLESVLIGHEDWVYSVRWRPPSADHALCLLSTSMDKTMTLWQPDPASGVWLEQVRVGEVGGNTLGLYGGVFGPRGDLILAHGYQGAFHLWKRTAAGTRTDQSEELERWHPLPTLSGHFGPVQDISWEPGSGRFIVSVSTDQTARLHAPWIRDGEKSTWHEIARPQIHGYDMQSVAMTTSLQYVSGADEKVLRVFEAPSNFLSNLLRISKVGLSEGGSELPVGASVPSLGLSNKAVFTSQEARSVKEGEEPVSKNAFTDHISPFTPANLSEPPVEEHLLQNTLWPETQKLYGHGYEIYCIASSPDAKYVVSACKATKQEHASIRVWETGTWRQVATLTSHTLTVTQLTFSHSGLYLLAVSRDRCWSLWKRTEGKEEALFRLSAQTNKTSRIHGRIIWGCSWASDDSCFATGSRDKKVFLWSQRGAVPGARDWGDGWRVASEPLGCAHAVTAVDFAPSVLQDERHVLAVGLESGEIVIYTCRLDPPEWCLAVAIDPALCHTSTVKRLQWRPRGDEGSRDEGGSGLTLASCSQDHAVRLFSVTL